MEPFVFSRFGMFDHIGDGLKAILGRIRFRDDEKALEKALEELRKTLLRSNVYHKVTKEIVQNTRERCKRDGIGKSSFTNALSQSILDILKLSKNYGFNFSPVPPTKVIMTGLQGSGKTTTCAKLANYLKGKNKKVMLVPCDLQRLAAVTQLKVLGEEISVKVLESEKQTPLEVAAEALERAQDYDVLIFDTAGRLAIDDRLMQELSELKSLIKPLDTFYVADALSGQDGIRSANTFNERIGITGMIMTKFDSDSRGGIALSVAYQLGIPLRFMGMGEKIPDLDLFIPDRIVSRLMGAGDIAGLAEKTASVIDAKSAKEIHKKIKKGDFTFDDFIKQIENIKKMGSIGSLISMIPGAGDIAKRIKDIDLDNSEEIKYMKAMVNSMTKKEREDPRILNGSRRKRIAAGSGLSVSDVNRTLKQFDNASKVAKKISKKGGIRDLLGMMSQNKVPR